MARSSKKPYEAVNDYFRSADLTEARIVFDMAKKTMKARELEVEQAAIVANTPTKAKGKKRGPKPGSTRKAKLSDRVADGRAQANEGIDPAPAGDPKL